MRRRKTSLLIASGLALIAGLAVASTLNISPNSDGTYTAWTPNSGTAHYSRVNESSCDGTTSYVSTNTTGNRDSYSVSLGGLTNGDTITQIAITPCASRNSNGGGSATLNVFYRLNGSNSSDFGNYSLSGTTPSSLSAATSSLSVVKTSTTTLEIGAVYSSGTKGARLSNLQAVITYTALASPSSSLTATFASNPNTINLSWTDYATTETGYSVERSTNGTSGWSVVATPAANSTSYTDISISTGTTYYYRVQATNSGGASAYSNTANASVPALPSDPSNLSVITNNTTSSVYVSISWTDNASNENGFYLERSVNSTSSWSVINSLTADTASDSDYNVSSGNTYYYKVRAYNGGGNSGYSNVGSVTLP